MDEVNNLIDKYAAAIAKVYETFAKGLLILALTFIIAAMKGNSSAGKLKIELNKFKAQAGSLGSEAVIYAYNSGLKEAESFLKSNGTEVSNIGEFHDRSSQLLADQIEDSLDRASELLVKSLEQEVTREELKYLRASSDIVLTDIFT